jgi:protein-tyrosine phosphatase
MQFIDTHSHLIPHFDDGSPDWQTSLEMLRHGQEDGIVEAVCTPHILSKADFDRENELYQLFEELRYRAKKGGISIKLHLAAELYIQPDLNLDCRLATFADNGRYFLVEFPMNLIPDFVSQRFFDLVMTNKIPIIAHPERNGRILRTPEKAYEFVERGALLQVNSGSLNGVFGRMPKIIAMQLIDANLIAMVATDAHDLCSRPFKLSQAYRLVANTWGAPKAQRLFYDNPRKIILGEDIQAEEPKPWGTFNGKLSLKDRFKLIVDKVRA